MIDPKYILYLQPLLEQRLGRPATADEVNNSITDQGLVNALLIQLHEENAAAIAATQVAVEKSGVSITPLPSI